MDILDKYIYKLYTSLCIWLYRLVYIILYTITYYIPTNLPYTYFISKSKFLELMWHHSISMGICIVRWQVMRKREIA